MLRYKRENNQQKMYPEKIIALIIVKPKILIIKIYWIKKLNLVKLGSYLLGK